MKRFSDYRIDTKGHTAGTLKTTCPECSATRTSKSDPCLSVDIDKGVWNCHHCGWAGGLPSENQKPATTSSPENKRAGGTVNASPLTPPALKWLSLRGISPETANAFGLKSCLWRFPKIDGESASVAIPFIRDAKVVNWKLRAITGKAFSQSRGGEQCLYNFDAVRGASTVILTEGEPDCWAIHESGLHHVCSCPAGAPPENARDISNKLAFLDDAAEVFADAEKIVLAGDADTVGLAWQKAIAEKLGPERCLQVTWSADCKDANDVLLSFGPEIVRECIDLAQPIPIQGLATFADYRREIVDYQAAGGLSCGLSTGWDSVDRTLRLRPGTLSILTGIPSSGKSEWLDQLMLNTIRLHDWRWAVFSPENHPPAYHFGKLAEKWNGKPLFNNWGTPPINQNELDSTITDLSRHIHLLTFDESPATVDGILNRLRSCAKRHRISGVILDPWNELEHVRPSGVSETEHIGQALTKFRNFARLHNVSVWIVAHPTKLQKRDDGSYPVPSAYDISGSANWRNKGDVCIAVWRNIGGENQHRVQIHVQKVRDKHLGSPGMVELDWQPSTGRFFDLGKLGSAPAWMNRQSAKSKGQTVAKSVNLAIADL